MLGSLVVVHIVAGAVGLISGGAAFLARKGGQAHRWAGRVFVPSMLVMATLGAAIAAFQPDRVSVIAGLVTVYLVGTSWLTVKRRAGAFGPWDIGALSLAVGIALAGTLFGIEGLRSPDGLIDGLPPQPAFVFAGLAGLGGMLDLTLVARKGVRGGHRLARHLWRMGLALVIAAASFFLGQQDVFPDALRGVGWAIPVLALLILTLVWVALALAGWPKNKRVTAAGPERRINHSLRTGGTIEIRESPRD